jgi:hypothetical protein
VAILAAPRGWTIPELPPGVSTRAQARGSFDVVVAFFRSRARVEARLATLQRVLRADGGLWIAWPRKATGHMSDISENALREIILPTGLVDTKVAALDEDWSALRFVWRKERRAALA